MIKVLIVEDSAVVQQFLVYVLSSDPEIRVIGTTNNGEEALEFLKQEKPDVIILDVMMPDISGLEVLRYMRREPSLLSIPVIVVSAKSMPGDIKIGFEAGASMYLTKPVGFLELKQAVEKVLQKV